ncbi:MAG: aspartate kinase, partial [Muribaculaceae bacterium]|nr:aspartate kinase [Muribaculaceae bacterium]
MKVLKFGGTSVGTPESMANVRDIVRSTPGRKVVVVSALGGITDALINTAHMAVEDNIEYLDNYARMVERHLNMTRTMVPEVRRADTEQMVRMLLDELGNIFKGVSLIHDLSPRALDIIVSYGERLSSLIVSAMLGDCTLFDARTFIKTRKNAEGANRLDTDLTNSLIAERLGNGDWQTAVVGGFIASDVNGDITNLGRGGSDYTASLLAAALKAEVLEIWTDVDGFMTADPKVIDTAYVIDELSFTEAMELCNFGAKVVFPPTIYPAYHRNIPILVKNTFRPEAPGTRISNNPRPDTKPIKGISSINDTALVTLSSLCMVGVVGVNTRIFSALSKHGVSVFLVSQAASENNTTIAVRNADARLAVDVLREEFSAELASGMYNDVSAQLDLATVAVVGENMRNSTGIMGKVFNTVGRNGINVIACAQGASEINISFVVERRSLRKTLNVIHDSFFLSECQVLNLFVAGVGNVGGILLQQIARQREKLLAEKRLRLNVVGIASSRRAVFDRYGLDPA